MNNLWKCLVVSVLFALTACGTCGGTGEGYPGKCPANAAQSGDNFTGNENWRWICKNHESSLEIRISEPDQDIVLVEILKVDQFLSTDARLIVAEQQELIYFDKSSIQIQVENQNDQNLHKGFYVSDQSDSLMCSRQ